ncbi:MAG: hypothetical protein DCC49_10995 [Acidobacteria bacterium]|nr:MAG: hypothetical protein DCC49_10995 [Acidobacteriota bacterium]
MEGQEAAAMLDYLAAVPQSGSIGVAGKLGGTEDKRLSVFSLFTASLEPLSYRETMSCIGRWILGGTAACFHEIRFGGAARYRAFYRIFGGSVIGFVGLHADE